jgi:hypothetical protein
MRLHSQEDAMTDGAGRELDAFPVDDDGNHTLVGGDFTLSKLLDFMSGSDPDRAHLIGYAGDVPIMEAWDQHYSVNDVIRALVAEVRSLRRTP